MNRFQLQFLNLPDVRLINHGLVSRTAAVVVAAFLGLAQNMAAQQLPAAGPQGSPQQPASSGSSGKLNSTPATPGQEDALVNPVLEQADAERNITYMQSHIEFEYNHDELKGERGWDPDSLAPGLRTLQSCGRRHRIPLSPF